MVYVHVPFCRSFCTYCDFYSEIACRGKDAGQQAAYLEKLLAEIEARREEIRDTSGTNTLYIGGGTPSVLPSAYIAAIARAVAEALDGTVSDSPTAPPLPVARWDEFTVEVNPEDIVEKGEQYARELLDAGVNRISMGVQSLDDGILRWMNRRHNAAGASQAFATLRRAGFRNISVDVIFGLSQLGEETLHATLDGILAWRPEHISAYQLSVEEGSALAGMLADGRYVEASDEQCRSQYELICRVLAGAGYVHYEISNWALPGYEAVHNSAYWTRQPYVGLGPGAHSLSGNVRSWNAQDLQGWIHGVAKESICTWELKGSSNNCNREILSREEVREEEIMLGLRTAKGVEESKLRCNSASVAGGKRCPDSGSSVDDMLASGLLERIGSRIRIPEDKFFISDSIISGLL